MNFSKRCVVFRYDSLPELSADASTLQPNLTLPETNIGGYINTGWDLVSNLAGATVACSLIAWCHGRSKRK